MNKKVLRVWGNLKQLHHVWCGAGTQAAFTIGSGFTVTPVPNSTLMVPANPGTVAPLGFWIVVRD